MSRKLWHLIPPYRNMCIHRNSDCQSRTAAKRAESPSRSSTRLMEARTSASDPRYCWPRSPTGLATLPRGLEFLLPSGDLPEATISGAGFCVQDTASGPVNASRLRRAAGPGRHTSPGSRSCGHRQGASSFGGAWAECGRNRGDNWLRNGETSVSSLARESHIEWRTSPR
jgi:hypothetical protein